jgi:hypothetical protein
MSTKKKKIETVIDTVTQVKNSTITVYPEPTVNQLFPTPLAFTKLPRKFTDTEIEFINAEYKIQIILVSELLSIKDLILIKLYCEYYKINELKDMLVRPIKKLI